MIKRCVFERRAQVYREIDEELRSQTRFYAAAALVNQALAKLFRLAPTRSLTQACDFLAESGAQLEAANLGWARELHGKSHDICEMDHILVRREQRLLQSILEADTGITGESWTFISGELNGILNGRHWCVVSAPCFGEGRQLIGVLSHVRKHLRARFDFNIESHRVELGLAIIRDVRERGRPKAHTFERQTSRPDQRSPSSIGIL